MQMIHIKAIAIGCFVLTLLFGISGIIARWPVIVLPFIGAGLAYTLGRIILECWNSRPKRT
jgi:hypothetical protein